MTGSEARPESRTISPGFRGFNPEAARFWEWVRADSKSTCGIALRGAQRVVASDIAACDFMAGSEDQRSTFKPLSTPARPRRS